MDVVNVEVRHSPVGEGPLDGLSDVFLAMERVPQLRDDPNISSFDDPFVDGPPQPIPTSLFVSIICETVSRMALAFNKDISAHRMRRRSDGSHSAARRTRRLPPLCRSASRCPYLFGTSRFHLGDGESANVTQPCCEAVQEWGWWQ